MIQCKFFHTAGGGCKHGSKCIFLHDTTPSQMGTRSAYSANQGELDHFEELSNDNELVYNSGHNHLNKSFANAVKENASFMSYSGASVAEQSKEICRFFSSGNCKFGEKCRNLHAIVDNSPLTQEKVAVKVECGICIESTSSPLYGILNNCDCKFCLSCIREWRKDGLRVAKDPLQVR